MKKRQERKDQDYKRSMRRAEKSPYARNHGVGEIDEFPIMGIARGW